MEYEIYVTFAGEHQARARKASEVPAEDLNPPTPAVLGRVFVGHGVLRPDMQVVQSSCRARFGNSLRIRTAGVPRSHF
jgi:hypothetical protein